MVPLGSTQPFPFYWKQLVLSEVLRRELESMLLSHSARWCESAVASEWGRQVTGLPGAPALVPNPG